MSNHISINIKRLNQLIFNLKQIKMMTLFEIRFLIFIHRYFQKNN